MPRTSARRLILLAGLGGGAVLAAGLSAAGEARWGIAVLSLLVGSQCLLMLDVRSRVADLAHLLRVAADRQRKLGNRLVRIEDGLKTRDPGAAVVGRLEVAERRLIGAIESERLRAADRHKEAFAFAKKSSADSLAAVRKATDRVERVLEKEARRQSIELEAQLQLMRRVAPRAPMPVTGDWALDAPSMLEALHLTEAVGADVVVELGSGASTVWLGYVLEEIGGRLVSLEHDEHFAQRTRAALSRHGLESVVDLRLAPLIPLQIGEESFDWYDPAALEGLHDVDVAFVDGPPKATGPLARYPALPLLAPLLVPGGLLVLDDSDRAEEQAVLARWAEEAEGARLTRTLPSRLTVLRLPI